MAGERGGTIVISSDQQHLLHKIRGFVRSLVVDISQGSLPIVSIDRYRIYCSDTSGKCYQNLRVVAVGRGLVMGWLRFRESGRNVTCIRSPCTAFPIPVEDVEDIVSAAHFILVVEKEAVFNRLANDRFCERNCCIIITGRGYPDASTRRFLRLLVEKLSLPAYFLIDCDPYGFEILITYRFGSLQMAFNSKLLSVPGIKWLGVLTSDLDAYHLPDRCFLPLTPRDKCKAEAMLERCYLHREVPEWKLELELMLAKGVKIEIEALSVTSFSFLSESYLPVKIQQLQC